MLCRISEEDVPEIVCLWNESIGPREKGCQTRTISIDFFKDIMSGPDYFPSGGILYRDKGRLLGFALGYIQKSDQVCAGDAVSMPARLAGIAVHPQHRGKGVGEKLLSAVEKNLSAEGKTEVAFETFKQPVKLFRGPVLDTGAYRFFIARGYQVWSHELFLIHNLRDFSLSDDIKRTMEVLESRGVQFRSAEASDHASLFEFMEQYFSGGWEARVKRVLGETPPGEVLIALDGGEISGFIGPFSVEERDDSGGFGSPGVAPEKRGIGIGKVLINLGLEKLKLMGAASTEFTTGVTNPARHVYIKAGATFDFVYCNNLRKSLA